MSSLQVEADLADVDDGRIGAGLPATIVLDAYRTCPSPDAWPRSPRWRRRAGAPRCVAPSASASRSIVSMPCGCGRAFPRASSSHAMSQRNALLAPRAAIDFSGAKPRVHLAGGKVVDVILGACNAQECVVKSGLNEGETLGRA